MTEPRLDVDVSRETTAKLTDLAAETRRWTARINLIGPHTVPDLWDRHIRDSAQLWAIEAPSSGLWLDLGSGGGYPGLVIAAIAAEAAPGLAVRLVESDRRKAAFLRQMKARLALSNLAVAADRIELLPPQSASILSARALAPLPKLLEYAEKHLEPGGIALFHKGRGADAEIRDARRTWRFDLAEIPSRTDQNASILRLERIERA